MSSYAFLNRVQIIGNVTGTPELKSTQDGTAVTSFSVATNRSYKVRDGEYKDEAEFHHVVVWAKLAELACKMLSKNMKVFVEGRLKTKDWVSDSGEKRYKTEIIVENFIILTPKSAQGHDGAPMPDAEY